MLLIGALSCNLLAEEINNLDIRPFDLGFMSAGVYLPEDWVLYQLQLAKEKELDISNEYQAKIDLLQNEMEDRDLRISKLETDNSFLRRLCVALGIVAVSSAAGFIAYVIAK